MNLCPMRRAVVSCCHVMKRAHAHTHAPKHVHLQKQTHCNLEVCARETRTRTLPRTLNPTHATTHAHVQCHTRNHAHTHRHTYTNIYTHSHTLGSDCIIAHSLVVTCSLSFARFLSRTLCAQAGARSYAHTLSGVHAHTDIPIHFSH